MINIIIALISGGIGALVSGVFALINRHLDKNDRPIENRLVEIDKRLGKSEKDSVRTQMLVLISDYSNNKAEILEAARHYFVDLHGDWYMTPIFNKWLEDQQIGKPEWFDSSK